MGQDRGSGNSQPKPSVTSLARDLGHLPPATRRVALEMSAALAGVSLRVSREFVSAAPRAAAILEADDLRNWAELGRRLAMGNVETAVKFFAQGAETLSDVPVDSRPDVFEICRRQLVLSSSIALESFDLIPTL